MSFSIFAQIIANKVRLDSEWRQKRRGRGLGERFGKYLWKNSKSARDSEFKEIFLVKGRNEKNFNMILKVFKGMGFSICLGRILHSPLSTLQFVKFIYN